MALTEVGSVQPRATEPPAHFDLRKITAPILLHLLRGKVRFPWLFLVKCKLTVSRFRKTAAACMFVDASFRTSPSFRSRIADKPIH
jgi:hypothetical protein